VGFALISQIARHKEALMQACGREVKIVAVNARDKTRHRGVDLSAFRWVETPQALAQDAEIDMFVELMGGAEGAARESVELALKHKKAVVTANKALLAAHGLALAALAESHNIPLNFEAAVAGGIPVIKTLRESQFGNEITRVFGILNGTCNYILTRMAQEDLSFEECLKDAQRLGYAEADPTFDVDGFDTAHKLALLTSLAFGTAVDAESISVQGIRSITSLDLKMADELGYRVKLLGVAQRTPHGVEQRVHPTFVPKDSVIGGVNGVLNAVAINGDAANLTLVGPGAGGAATASAVVADIADVARNHKTAPFIRPVASLTKLQAAPMSDHKGGYYIRLDVKDISGAFAKIAAAMGDNKISLESIIQKPAGRTASPVAYVPVVLITHSTCENAIRRALDKIEADGDVIGQPQVIRIERD
jgi:homoserine dehydrogenase